MAQPRDFFLALINCGFQYIDNYTPFVNKQYHFTNNQYHPNTPLFAKR
jgi:hypothetical protein